MERLILYAYICLALDSNVVFSLLLQEDAPTLGSKTAPRLVTKNSVKRVFENQELQNYSVFYYRPELEEMYIGGINAVLRINTTNYQILEKYDLSTAALGCREASAGSTPRSKDSCLNVITLISELNHEVFVCGTNAGRPQCWTLQSGRKNYSSVGHDGSGISPVESSQNSLSLSVEGDLYTAAPLDPDGNLLQFRRKAGSRTPVSMYNSWVSEPTFLGASWVKRDLDPDNEKIYVFFREKNSDSNFNSEAGHWVSRVARVCKVDEGGSKRFFQNTWTSFLKARLVCGFHGNALFFNLLQDVFVQQHEDWNNTKVYGIFRSSWNATAVCVFTIGAIENVFENSSFKGFDGEIPTPRPGTCVSSSRSLPLASVSVLKDFPEMSRWVHSVHQEAPLYVSDYNYTKITVDQVRGADDTVVNVLLLATDSGKIHKVLEAGPKAVVVSETQLPSRSPVLSIKLDSKKRRLVVGFVDLVVTVDLQKCDYSGSCEDCVLAQDPYCSWAPGGQEQYGTGAPGGQEQYGAGAPGGQEQYGTGAPGGQCTATSAGGIQNVLTGDPRVCPTPVVPPRSKRQAQTLLSVHEVPLDVPFYLSCPIDSYHAHYSWEHRDQQHRDQQHRDQHRDQQHRDQHRDQQHREQHRDQQSPCLQMRSSCLLLIPSMSSEHYGKYQCVSREQGYSKVLKQYLLKVQSFTDTKETKVDPHSLNNAAAPVSRGLWLTLGLVLATA